ncbi:MAG TPA: N-6 DNA methylase, partial [Planctomycetaceae bacterium]|nr:N-6 DNA methylase [Planctomycetaceae bacterium]
MGNSGRNGGEYYSRLPLVRAIVRVVKPQIGDKISDDACGSCGFLCESFENMKERKEVQQNFPIRTGETAFLFLQRFIKILKVGGRARSSRTRSCLARHRGFAARLRPMDCKT